MIDIGFVLSSTFETVKWFVACVAGAENVDNLGENSAKVMVNITTALLGEAASARWTQFQAGRALKSVESELNNLIEQSYRSAELLALCEFLRRVKAEKSLPGDGLGDADAQRTIESLRNALASVLAHKERASTEGIELEHLAATLMSLSQREWDNADASASKLRSEIEARALRDLEWTSGVAPSAAFKKVFAHGAGGRVPPWFGLLSHCFMHVLLNENRTDARNSLMLRLLSRTAVRLEPGRDPQALEHALRYQLDALERQGKSIGEGFLRSLDLLGNSVGSRLDEVIQGQGEIRSLLQYLSSSGDAAKRELEGIRFKLDEVAEFLKSGHSGAPGVRDRAALEAAASAGALPPLPALDGVMLGREREVSQVHAFLEQPSAVVLRVTGRGGVGKTTLVAQALRAAAVRPVIYLKANDTAQPLFPLLRDALDHLLRSLGVASLGGDAPGRTSKGMVEEAFARLTAHPARAVILIDSIEQAIEPASGRLTDAELEAFLICALYSARAPQVVICGQRMPEVMANERVVALSQVAPERQRSLVLSGLTGNDGVALLRALLAPGRPDLADSPDASLRPLCEAVGGVPNAIKHLALALDNDPLLAPAALRADLVSVNAGGAASTVQDVLLGRFFDALPSGERLALQAVAVLGGRCARSALEAVAGVEAGAMTAELRSLLQRRLLSVSPAGQPEREDQFSLHDSERAYCLRVLAVEAARELQRRGAAHFARHTRPLREWQDFADATPALREADFRAAVGELDLASQVRVRAARRLHEIGRARDALSALDAASADERAAGDTVERAAVAATCLWKTGAFAEAETQCRRALKAPASVDHPARLALRRMLASCRIESGDALAAVNESELLLKELEEAGSMSEDARRVQVMASIDVAFGHSLAGRQNDALSWAARATSLADGLPDARDDGLTVLSRAYLGLIQSYHGAYAAARETYVQAQRLARAQSVRYEHAILAGNFAELELIEGRFDFAVDLARRSLSTEAQVDAKNGSWCNWLVGMVAALDPAQWTNAEFLAREACRFTRPLNDPNPRALLGLMLLLQGRAVEAAEELAKAVAVSDELLRACGTNWEAGVARAYSMLLLSTVGHASLGEAIDQYEQAHAASPFRGHLDRIALQLQIAQPRLGDVGAKVLTQLQQLYRPD